VVYVNLGEQINIDDQKPHCSKECTANGGDRKINRSLGRLIRKRDPNMKAG
jgi:hypothetical protein